MGELNQHSFFLNFHKVIFGCCFFLLTFSHPPSNHLTLPSNILPWHHMLGCSICINHKKRGLKIVHGMFLYCFIPPFPSRPLKSILVTSLLSGHALYHFIQLQNTSFSSNINFDPQLQTQHPLHLHNTFHKFYSSSHLHYGRRVWIPSYVPVFQISTLTYTLIIFFLSHGLKTCLLLFFQRLRLQPTVAPFPPAPSWPTAPVAVVVNLGHAHSSTDVLLMIFMFNLGNILCWLPFPMQSSALIHAWCWQNTLAWRSGLPLLKQWQMWSET